MVKFCQKCGNLLIPQYEKGKKSNSIRLYCNCCRIIEKATVAGISYQLKTRIKHNAEDRLQIFEENFSVDPVVRQSCPKCGFLEAYYWQGGNRRKQEWESTTYYRCIRCKNTWND